MLPPTGRMVKRVSSFTSHAAITPSVLPPVSHRPPSRRASFTSDAAPPRIPSAAASRRASDAATDVTPQLPVPVLGLGANVAQLLTTSVTPLVTELVEEDQVQYSSRSLDEVFTLGEVLGEGSYGLVRAATHIETGQQYAIKVLTRRRGTDDRTDTIENEVRLWSRVNSCSNVVGLHSVYRDDTHVYIAQELCSGGDLQTLLDSVGSLSEVEAAVAMHGVLSALAACHAQGICFGDVKPANFMLGHMYPNIYHLMDPSKPKGSLDVRATDFGCAQYCPDGCNVSQGLSGTPVFMAPEIIVDRCYHLPIDVWAAGVMAYQLLTGRFPFWDTDLSGLNCINPRQILEDIKAGMPLLDVACCQGLSAEAKQLLGAMLTRDPEQRITAAQALEHPWFDQAREVLSGKRQL